MEKIKCSNCDNIIPLDDINISTDIALCRICSTEHKYSVIRNYDELSKLREDLPPKGAWYRKDINTITIGASTRSNGAFFSIPFTLVWAGGSMFGIYGSQITSGEFDLGTSLLGIPFLIGSVVMIYLCIMQTIGKIEITIDKFNTKTFIGAYDFGFKKKI